MSDGSDRADTSAAMLQMLANISTQLARLNEKMEQARSRSPQRRADMPESSRRQNDGGLDRSPTPPSHHHEQPPRHPMDEEYQHRPPPPPPQHHQQPDVKLTPPTFAGRVDPEAYLDWEMRMEHIFDYYRYADPRKVALAAAQFTDHALTWWDREVAERRRNRYGQIAAWEDLKHIMRRRYVPPHFTRELQKRFRRLTQGSKSVEVI